LKRLNCRQHLAAFAFTKAACAIAFLLLAISIKAQAKNIYAAPGGSDSNAGTQSQPVATPRKALQLASPGDTIFLRGGRYPMERFLWIDKPNVAISSQSGERALLAGSNTDSQTSPPSIIIVVANNVSLINLDIEGGSYYALKIDLDNNKTTNGVVVKGCRIRNSGRDCVKTFNADNLLIEDCEIGPSGLRDPSNAEGIDSIGSVGVTIRNSFVHDTATTGIYLKGGARDGIVERNRFERCGNSGLLLGQDTDPEYMRDGAKYEAINCVARNNIISAVESAGIGTYSGDNIRFENNTVYDAARKNQAGFYVVTNGRGVPAQRITFKNNIVVILGERPAVFILNLADRLVCDSNIYHAPNASKPFRRETKSTGEQYDAWSFVDWKANMNLDSHSILADPMLEGDLLKPRSGSPAFDNGESLPQVKTDYAGIARPQGSGYDIGAHEGRASGGAASARPKAETTGSESSSETALTRSTALIGGAGFGALAAVAAMAFTRKRGAKNRAIRARRTWSER